MNNYFQISTDPYAGVRAAYFALLPPETDESWEKWVEKRTCPKGRLDDYGALASLCREALNECPEIAGETAELLRYSEACFRAYERVIDGIVDAMPTSPCIPHHFPRYQANLRKFPERYQDGCSG